MASPADNGSRLRRETFGLGILFGTVYFVQAISDPSDGLISQPVISLLKQWQWGKAEITAFTGLLGLAWSVKPIFGLLSDFVPLAGYRRKSYLILASVVTIASLAVLYHLPLGPDKYRVLFVLLFLPTMAVACSDVVADALMIEKGQPRGITGTLQAVQWAALYAGVLVTGAWGGYLSQNHEEQLSFILCAGVTIATLVLALLMREPAHTRPRQDFRSVLAKLWQMMRSPTILGVGVFLFLWNFNPFSSTVLNLHMTQELGFDEQFFGLTVSFAAMTSIVACLFYGQYCRSFSMATLVHASIILGILSSLAYWALTDEMSAFWVSLAFGFTYMTATLILLDLAARACPPEIAGTAFAVIMALQNLSASLATWVGGEWYELWSKQWGSQRAFDLLVGVGALFTAGCWLVWPFMRNNLAVRTPAST